MTEPKKVHEKRAVIRASIWNDADWLAMSPAAQHMYMFLVSHPERGHLGRLRINYKPWALKAKNWTRADMEAALIELEECSFVAVDTTTDEVVIRTYVRNDEVYKHERTFESCLKEVNTFDSDKLKAVVAAEIAKIPFHTMGEAARGKCVETAQRLIHALTKGAAHLNVDGGPEQMTLETSLLGSHLDDMATVTPLDAQRVKAANPPSAVPAGLPAAAPAVPEPSDTVRVGASDGAFMQHQASVAHPSAPESQGPHNVAAILGTSGSLALAPEPQTRQAEPPEPPRSRPSAVLPLVDTDQTSATIPAQVIKEDDTMPPAADDNALISEDACLTTEQVAQRAARDRVIALAAQRYCARYTAGDTGATVSAAGLAKIEAEAGEKFDAGIPAEEILTQIEELADDSRRKVERGRVVGLVFDRYAEHYKAANPGAVLANTTVGRLKGEIGTQFDRAIPVEELLAAAERLAKSGYQSLTHEVNRARGVAGSPARPASVQSTKHTGSYTSADIPDRL